LDGYPKASFGRVCPLEEYSTRNAFESQFIASNVGINRHFLQKLVSIIKSSVPFQPSRASQILPKPNPQTPTSRLKLLNTRVPAAISPASTRWTTGLRIEPSWKPQMRTIVLQEAMLSPRLLRLSRAASILYLLLVLVSLYTQAVRHFLPIFKMIAYLRIVPDFRSQDGLYRRAGRDVFDGSTLKENDRLAEHHKVMGMITELSQRSEPTPFHHMISYLAEKAKSPLHRYYTQNIERTALSSCTPYHVDISIRQDELCCMRRHI
jgi:hypothetical protein